MASIKNKNKVNPALGAEGKGDDGNMDPNMAYLRERAKKLGLTKYSKLSKTDLIHRIQIAEGYTPCYGSTSVCSQDQCLFRNSCLA
jgi:hypothetical protein